MGWIGFTITVDNASGTVNLIGSFDLDDDNSRGSDITYANGRFYVLDQLNDVFAYSDSGQRDQAADFGGLRCCSYDGIAFDEDRIYVVVSTEIQNDQRVYAYGPGWQRDSSAEFDLIDDNGSPAAMTAANGRLYVVDFNDARVYAYRLDRHRDAAVDFEYFELDEGNQHPSGIVYANDRFYVVDNADNKVYAYRSDGRRDSMTDFDLHADNGVPRGIAYHNGQFHIVDYGDKVYRYSDPMAPSEDTLAESFDLDEPNSQPTGITYADGRFYVLNWGEETVDAYRADGQRDTSADFALSDSSFDPQGITYTGGRFYVVNEVGHKVFAYGVDGTRDSAADFGLYDINDTFNPFPRGITHNNVWDDFNVVDRNGTVYNYHLPIQPNAWSGFPMHADNTDPVGITYANERFYVVDNEDHKVYVYRAVNRGRPEEQQRDAASEFDLHQDNRAATGITYANGRFYVVDSDDRRVYSYVDQL